MQNEDISRPEAGKEFKPRQREQRGHPSSPSLLFSKCLQSNAYLDGHPHIKTI